LAELRFWINRYSSGEGRRKPFPEMHNSYLSDSRFAVFKQRQPGTFILDQPIRHALRRIVGVRPQIGLQA
jgi:hypothetical protein